MTASAVLKKVKKAYPEIFEKLPKPRLKLVENAIIYASKLSETEEVLSDAEHRNLLKDVTGRDRLSTGDRLKAYRLRKDLSQVELSKRCGISQANISAMEAGKRPIGIQSAKKLAVILDCDYRQLV
jgi:DNA-binding XRE family transcriptional regulator